MQHPSTVIYDYIALQHFFLEFLVKFYENNTHI